MATPQRVLNVRAAPVGFAHPRRWGISLMEAWQLAFDAILMHKLRSFLTLLGVIIGVTVVTTVAAVIEGAELYVREKIADLGQGIFRVEKASFEVIGDFRAFLQARAKNPDLTREDYEALKARVPNAVAIGAKDSSTLPVKYGSSEISEVNVQGVTPNMVDLSNVTIEVGRYIDDTDELRRRAVCVIGADIVEGLFPQLDPLGKQIKIGDQFYTVIGVAKKLGSVLGQSQDNFVIVPLSTFQKQFGARRSLSIYIKGDPAVPLQRVQDQTRVVLRSRHQLAYNQEDDFSLVTNEATEALFGRFIAGVAAVALPVTGISLIVGGIVIMNTMLVSVSERTKEIGIRKSVGARRRDITIQFLLESSLLAGVGGVIGVVIALIITTLGSRVIGIPMALPLWALAAALLVSTGVGLTFGIYPAFRAARLDPVEAMRTEN
ncbi:MAG: ABC transporter permease [Acidobacteriota bacterium]|nr:ABC transporter permease [Blastocatellia bacterium]MDW8238939.1 ABC transporter permease [Acidobacteriota bacterium]